MVNAGPDGISGHNRDTLNYEARGSIQPMTAEYPGRDSNPHDREAGGF